MADGRNASVPNTTGFHDFNRFLKRGFYYSSQCSVQVVKLTRKWPCDSLIGTNGEVDECLRGIKPVMGGADVLLSAGGINCMEASPAFVCFGKVSLFPFQGFVQYIDP
jgi:hypothetical protein